MRALELRKSGASYREIARQLGADLHTVHGDIQAELAEMKEELAEVRLRVEAAHTSAAALRQKGDILDPDPESANSLIGTSCAAKIATACRKMALSARSRGCALASPTASSDAVRL